MALTKVPSNLDATIATTQSQADNSTNIATTAYVDLAVSNLSDSAPAALNTLNEIAAALGDDANYASTTTAAIAAKLPLAGGTLTGNLTVNAIVDADNFKVNGAQGSDGQVLTSTGSGIAWESIPAGGVDGIVSSADATAITIDSLENVGIGETSPLGKLHVKSADSGAGADAGADELVVEGSGDSGLSILSGASNNGTILFSDSGDSAAGGLRYEQNNNALNFRTNGAWNRLYINSSGNVGIGTTSPDFPIHVKGAGHQRIKVEKTDAGGDADISIACRSDGIGWLLFTDAQAGNNSGVIKYVHNGDYMSFRTNGTDDRMRITSNGNVGIGTASPDIESLGSNYKQLTIASSTSLYPGMLTFQTPSSASGSAEIARVHYYNGTTRAAQFLVKPDGAANSAYMAWSTMNAGTLGERMRISSAGNVGIGTNAPGNILEVSHSAASNTPVLRLTGTHASAYSGGLEFYTGYGGGKTVATMHATASASQGGEYWQEVRNHSTNTLKRTYHVNNAAKHTFYGQHNGDSTGHFLFTNQLHDAASTNCSLVVQNGYTFIQVMGWTSLGARIGTRTGGWSGNSGGDVYFTRQDATSIKLASSGPQLSNGTAISSDERLKENITNIADGQLAKINALTPRNFTWKDTRKTGTHEGFIAQEVEAVIPEAVYEDNWAPDPDDDSRDFEGDIKLIRHEVINARLIKAVQELSAKLEAAEARITTLEG